MTSEPVKKRGGRPPKSPDDVASELIAFRVTPAALAKLTQRAAAAGQTNVNDYARAAALGQPVTVRHQASFQVNAVAVTALNRLGVNLNQIAHHLNAGRQPHLPAIEALLAQITATMDELLAHDTARP